MCLPGLNALSFDPATNNDPLQFNGSSGPLVPECPPLENASENSKKRKRASVPPGTDISSFSRKCTLLYVFALSLPSHEQKKTVQKMCNALICARASGGRVVLVYFFLGQCLLISLPCPEALAVCACREVRPLQQEAVRPTLRYHANSTC